MPIQVATLCLLLLALNIANADELRGYVVGITDGDTLTLLVEQQPRKVRIVGIDAPERHQPFGERSRQNLSKLAFHKNVIADCPKKDRYKRDLCQVMVGELPSSSTPTAKLHGRATSQLVDGQDVGLKQIADGMAWWYRKYAHEQAPTDRVAYERAEVMARTKSVGLWVDGDAVAPWEWRKRAYPHHR